MGNWGKSPGSEDPGYKNTPYPEARNLRALFPGFKIKGATEDQTGIGTACKNRKKKLERSNEIQGCI